MLTAKRKCSSDGCNYVFESVTVLYGTSALGRCPVCGAYVELPADKKPEPNAQVAEPIRSILNNFAAMSAIGSEAAK